jgi:hypothetical protein
VPLFYASGGREYPAPPLAGLTITGSRFSIDREDFCLGGGAIRVRRGTWWNEIDFVYLSSRLGVPDVGEYTRFGVYRIEGDKLALCMTPPGEGRPEGYHTTAADERAFWVYRRRQAEPLATHAK